MKSDHIRLWEHEWDDPVDETHLAECERCRRQLEIARFLRAQLEAAPRVEPPAFFAARVQNSAAHEARPSLVFYFQRIAAQLAPLLTVLILATTFLIYMVSQGDYSPSAALETAAFPEISVDSLIAPAQDLDEGPNK